MESFRVDGFLLDDIRERFGWVDDTEDTSGTSDPNEAERGSVAIEVE